MAHRDGADLNRWFGKLGNAQHSSCWRGLGKDFGENSVHFPILAYVLEIDLGVDHVLHGQTRGLDNQFDIVESLPGLCRKSRRQTAVRAARSLPGDVYVVACVYTGREMIQAGRGRRRGDGSHLSLDYKRGPKQ